ncbi:hypothetical protein E3T25_02880 [Cryobacterium sandaracinum]|uniref:DUF2637 domain-containing protein n=1 Tax=Cryobacterium sandaracinum TaxID=1259247 RepID=A0ABY2JI89_9MICO|nr:hypothetical protein [Cryobacterium sandaracinum]TFD06282.1 hypothetical protein E3T25_02880 [Cryobacterium sandaracinum]
MKTERTASRQVALSICVGMGLAGTVVALILMAVDQVSSDSIAAHVQELYEPFGKIPDPIVPWIFQYSIFAVGVVGWAIASVGAWRKAWWSRWWCAATFCVGSALLIFAAVVSEHGSPILPLPWRIVSIAVAAVGAITTMIAWLPTTDRITE